MLLLAILMHFMICHNKNNITLRSKAAVLVCEDKGLHVRNAGQGGTLACHIASAEVGLAY